MFSWKLTINKPDLQYIKTPKVTSENKRIRWPVLHSRYQCFRLFLFYSVNSIKVRIVNGQRKWSRVNYLMLATAGFWFNVIFTRSFKSHSWQREEQVHLIQSSLQSKPMDWFWFDRGLRHERVKPTFHWLTRIIDYVF